MRKYRLKLFQFWGMFLLLSLYNLPLQAECLIKGSGGKIKLYYTPDHPQYQAIRIGENPLDQWFCSEEEARFAGFAKAGTPKLGLDLTKPITNATLKALEPITLKRATEHCYPWWGRLQERNLFDQVSSNFSWVGHYVWIDLWGTKDLITKALVLIRFPVDAPGSNKDNQKAFLQFIQNLFPESPDLGEQILAAVTKEDTHFYQELGKKTITVDSVVAVKQLMVFVTLDPQATLGKPR